MFWTLKYFMSSFNFWIASKPLSVFFLNILFTSLQIDIETKGRVAGNLHTPVKMIQYITYKIYIA